MELTNQKIVFLGDSITEGIGVADPKNIYWRRLEQDGCKVYGYGVSGTRIAPQATLRVDPRIDDDYFVTRIPKMEADADVVVIFGGTNDYGHGDAALGSMDDRTVDTFYGAYHDLCIKIREKYPNAAVVVMTPLHRDNEHMVYNGFHVRTAACLETYVNIIKEVAEYHKLSVLDLYHDCDINPNLASHKENYVPDGLHPNDAGHEIIYNTLKNFLKNL